MNSLQTITTVILGSIYTSITNGEVGGICKSDADCVRGFCSSGVCNCTRIHYGVDLFPYCQEVYPKMECYDATYCMLNAHCIDDACQCNEGYVRIRDTCRQVIYRGLMEPCGGEVDGKPEMCDISKHIVCLSQRCLCSHGFIPNSSGVCKSRITYLSLNNLTEYRVKPGLYCRSDKECLEGLECKKLQCSCPTKCKYIREREVCDCGEVETPIAPIIIGCILGLFIIGFWSYTIRKTVKVLKFRNWFYDIPEHLRKSSSYTMSRLRAETTSDASTSLVGVKIDSSPPHQEEGSRLLKANNNPELRVHLPNPEDTTRENPPTDSDLDPPPPYPGYSIRTQPP